MDFVKKLTDNINLILKICSLLAIIFVGYNFFAKQADLEALAMDFKEDKKERRIKYLSGVVFDCKTKYKNETNEFILKTCKDAEIELESLKDKKG
jgi:hypothetical protein